MIFCIMKKLIQLIIRKINNRGFQPISLFSFSTGCPLQVRHKSLRTTLHRAFRYHPAARQLWQHTSAINKFFRLNYAGIIAITISFFFLSCNQASNNKQFTITGEVKNFSARKIYLEQLNFGNQQPGIIDSAAINNGKFTIQVKAKEEGLYRLRFANQKNGFLFINDKENIHFKVDSLDLSLDGPFFSTPANGSLKKFIGIMDSLKNNLMLASKDIQQLQQQGAKATDSSATTAINTFNNIKESITKFCFQYGDTATSPIVALFSVTTAPVEIEKFELPLQKLVQRFPKHTALENVVAFTKQQINLKAQQNKALQQQSSPAKAAIGNMAPDLTMPDTEGNNFSLSMLRGKYVLVDFWASWCGPCRAENPNVVAAYNEFKDKNFTVLGVSLDQNKKSWLQAIEKDKLTWKHISDLQFWNSAAVDLYGFDGIPYNVLIDPEGKIIAENLRGEELSNKLKEVLR